MFIAVLFTIAKIWKQPKCPSIDEENVVYCMNGSWGHYAKWNNSDRKRQIPYNPTYM